MLRRLIGTQALGVVGVIVTGRAAENRLTQKCRHRVLCVFSRSLIPQEVFGCGRQAESFVEFALGNQPTIGSGIRAMELQFDSDSKTTRRALLPFSLN